MHKMLRKIAMAGGSTGPEQESNEQHFLNIGEIISTAAPTSITTILGTCVSACIWDPILRHGSMSHFVLPRVLSGSSPSNRFGEVAIPNQIRGIMALGSKRHYLHARIYGGGRVTCHINDNYMTGSRNAKLALSLLRDEGINVVEAHVGGGVGRKIRFNVSDGSVIVKTHRAQASMKCPHFDQRSNSCAACGRMNGNGHEG